MAKVLVVDDDQLMCELLTDMIERMGHEADCAYTLEAGVGVTQDGAFDVVFLDVRLPDGSGLDGLPSILNTSSSPEVIIMTGAGDPNGAELAIRSGAWDYVEKPLSVTAMQLPFIRALEYRKQKKAREACEGSDKQIFALKCGDIVGDSPQMRGCLDAVAQGAKSDANVLITGETGTGKELFAWAIHENSARSNRPFVVVDCAALPETLVESILFGHEKGVFTGADKAQDGMIKQADGGTLFLDEVGELPLSVQKAFLRVLQERCFRVVGGKMMVQSDFRLVAATNRDLGKMVQEGGFRKDLFFRLNSLTIELPALAGRSDDIKELAIHYIAKLCEKYGTGIKGFCPELMEVLVKYDWPGNVRELVHCLEATLASARYEPTLFPRHLPIHIRIHVARNSVGKDGPNHGQAGTPAPFPKDLPKLAQYREEAVVRAEKEYLDGLTSATGSDIKEACRVSGLSRPRLYALLKKYSINRKA